MQIHRNQEMCNRKKISNGGLILFKLLNGGELCPKYWNKVEKIDVHTKSENLSKNSESETTSKTVNQIKNIAQEDKNKPEVQTEIKAENKNKTCFGWDVILAIFLAPMAAPSAWYLHFAQHFREDPMKVVPDPQPLKKRQKTIKVCYLLLFTRHH